MRSSVQLELAPPQDGTALLDAEGVGVPLVAPDPLQLEGAGPPLGRLGGAGAEGLEQAEQGEGLGLHGEDR